MGCCSYMGKFKRQKQVINTNKCEIGSQNLAAYFCFVNYPIELFFAKSQQKNYSTENKAIALLYIS